MNDKELKLFIEKLIKVLPEKRLWLIDEIKAFDKTINPELISNKLFELNLVKESSEIYDELSERGLKLKELGTFKKLEKFEKAEPKFFKKYQYEILALGVFIAVLTYFRGCSLTTQKTNESNPSQNHKNLNNSKLDTLNKYDLKELKDSL